MAKSCLVVTVILQGKLKLSSYLLSQDYATLDGELSQRKDLAMNRHCAVTCMFAEDLSIAIMRAAMWQNSTAWDD